MIWRRLVVCSLGSVLGLLLYLSGRLVRGGTTASLLYGAAIAHKLASTEITCEVGVGTPPSLQDAAYIKSGGRLTWRQLLAYSKHLARGGERWEAAGGEQKM